MGRLAIFVIALCFCMMITDGYDFGSLSVATPAILRDWHIQPKEMGAVFSVTFFGLLIGSLFYGWMGDRYGRRFTIIFGTFNFGLPVLLIIWASNAEELKLLRFLGGVGMGGIVPIAYTLVSDYAPRRSRSTVTVITNAGYSVGVALTGLVASSRSYRATAGSRSSLSAPACRSAMAVVLAFTLLPESPLFLSAQGSRRRRGAAPAGQRACFATSWIGPDVRFVPGDPPGEAGQGRRRHACRNFSAARARRRRFFLWIVVCLRRAGVSSSWRAGCRW